MTGEAGKRQSWLYTAEYYGGVRTEHICPCPVIAFELSRPSLIEKLKLLKRQPFKETYFIEKLPIIKNKITILLRQRRCRENLAIWESFFSNAFPSSVDDPKFFSVKSNLIDLVSKYTKTVQVIINSICLFIFLKFIYITAKNSSRLHFCPQSI
jgi:hypothetical protein